jgi:hypothetical protein
LDLERLLTLLRPRLSRTPKALATDPEAGRLNVPDDDQPSLAHHVARMVRVLVASVNHPGVLLLVVVVLVRSIFSADGRGNHVPR